MDSSILLDYALFQLTPTRTRCDLVVVCGGKSEKIASGLVETFISHLRFAKDQVLKGGYSITLRPPNPSAFWFTKITFLRFVRFVSTPEILERFVHIEREILQIENSIQGNDGSKAVDGIHKKPTNSDKITSGVERDDDDATVEETSKLHLQRLLKTRKALLQKEQAMAYARAMVAGFEIDILENLICFADIFGASRLREACLQFKELHKKKHTDVQWMEELAAMQALSSQELHYTGTPGITLAYENDMSPGITASPPNSDSATDNKLNGSTETPSTPAKVQMQMPWPNQMSQYMQIPPYQGYPYPPFFPGHMPWPQSMENSAYGNVQELNSHRHHKSSGRKQKTSSSKGTETSEDDEQTESSSSGSGADSDTVRKEERKHSSKDHSRGRKQKKKSSKTVVIRNINYITSKKRSDDSSSIEALEEDSIRREVADVTHDLAAKVFEEDGKNDHWGAFQTILQSHGESISDGVKQQHNANFPDEQLANFQRSDNEISQDIGDFMKSETLKDKTQHLITDDSVLMTHNRIEDEGKVNSADFANGENLCTNMKKMNYQEAPFLSNGLEESGGNSLATPSDFASEETVTRRNITEEEWFTVNHSENARTRDTEQIIFGDNDPLPFAGDSFVIETSKNSAAIDDSFMVQSRSEVDNQYDSVWRTDSVVGWIEADDKNTDASALESRTGKSGMNEPDDLCVVLARDTVLESTRTSWTPEMDYGMEMYIADVDKRSNSVEMKDQIEDKVPENGKTTSTKKNSGPTTKKPAKDASSRLLQGSLAKSNKTQPGSRLMAQKSKLETEEEMRKRMEELTVERKKRIAERSAGSGVSPAPSGRSSVGGNKPAVSKPQSKVRLAKN